MSDKTKAGAEPSMDDILASIRKILNEDDVPGAPATSPAPPPEPLMLTEEMLVAEPPPGVHIVAPPEPVMDTVIETSAPPAPRVELPVALPVEQTVEQPVQPAMLPIQATPSVPQTPARVPARPETTRMPEQDLVAPAAAAAAAASMRQLLRAVSQERSATVTRNGPSIEDVVREEVRPILKEWLDAHLPGIVERAVRAEIERVVGRNL